MADRKEQDSVKKDAGKELAKRLEDWQRDLDKGHPSTDPDKRKEN